MSFVACAGVWVGCGVVGGLLRAWYDPYFPKTYASEFRAVLLGYLLLGPLSGYYLVGWMLMEKGWQRYRELKRKAEELEWWRNVPVEQLTERAP